MKRAGIIITAAATASFGFLTGGAQATGEILCAAQLPQGGLIVGNPGEIIQQLSGDAPRDDAPRPPELAAGAGAATVGEAIQDNCATPADLQ